MNYSSLLASSVNSQTGNGGSESSSGRTSGPVQVSSHRGKKGEKVVSSRLGKEKE